MTVQAAAARRMAERDPARAEASFAVVENTGREALTELRRLLGVLRREDEELALAPQPSLAHVRSLIQRATACRPARRAADRRRAAALPAGVDLTAYRLVQEALRRAREGGRRGARERARRPTRPARSASRWSTTARPRTAACSGCASASPSTAASSRPPRPTAAAGASRRPAARWGRRHEAAAAHRSARVRLGARARVLRLGGDQRARRRPPGRAGVADRARGRRHVRRRGATSAARARSRRSCCGPRGVIALALWLTPPEEIGGAVLRAPAVPLHGRRASCPSGARSPRRRSCSRRSISVALSSVDGHTPATSSSRPSSGC